MFSRPLFFILLSSIALMSAGQVKPPVPDSIKNLAFPGLSFRSLGPAFIGGRVVDIAVNPQNKSEYYVASGHGSLWKTINNGVTFSPIFDGQKSYSIGAVKIDPSNPNIVWVGTGENNNQNNVIYGDGVYRSEDAGKSWKNMGIKNSEHIGGIVIDPKNSNTVYVAAYGSLRNEGGDRGIYKTTDGGKTWKRPKTPPHGYRSCVEYLNKDQVVTCGLNGVDYSIDGGKNWKWISTEGFHACRFARFGSSVYLAGGNGKIGKLVWP